MMRNQKSKDTALQTLDFVKSNFILDKEVSFKL